MNATIARLTVRTLLGRRRALLLLLLPAVLLAVAGGVRWAQGEQTSSAVGVLGGFGLGTLVPLLGLLAGTAAIGTEIDDGSIVYLLSKPLSRPTIVRTKLVVASATAIVLSAVPTLIAGFVLLGTTDRIAVAYAVAATVASITYCAGFLLLAVVTRNAVVIGLIYALVWETVIGGYVPGAQALSVQQWSTALAERIVGAKAAQDGVTAAVSLGTAVPLLLAVLIGSTWYAGRRLRSIRLTGDD